MIYFSYVHYIMTYGVIFGEISSCGSNIFKIKKRTIRIITNSWNRDSCWGFFKKL